MTYTILILPGHFGMHNTTSSCHELQISRTNGAFVSCKIFMVDRAAKQIGNGLLPPNCWSEYCITIRHSNFAVGLTHLCGWSGKPAFSPIVKWSSIRNGEKFLSCGTPMDRRTRAPAPSDFSTAWKALAMALATDMTCATVISGTSASKGVLKGRFGVS